MMIAVLPDHVEESTCYTIRENYLTALHTAGGRPLVVPYEDPAPYLDVCGGLMIIGGGFTIDPALFGQTLATTMTLKPRRTTAELAFFHEAYQRKMPILGICGGMQLMNVALGGDLIQDIDTHHRDQCTTPLAHVAANPHEVAHHVDVVPGTLLANILGDVALSVNTSHRQAVHKLGVGLQVNARAPDGIIEGLESTAHPFCLGLQWHPEYQANPLDALIFTAFIAHAQNYLWNSRLGNSNGAS